MITSYLHHSFFLVVLLLLCYIHSAHSQSVKVAVNWANVTFTSNTHTTLQCVVNPLYERGSPIHDQTFAALANLGADYVRFQGWNPYPDLVVAELYPPTGNPLCGSASEGQSLYLGCYEGVIESIQFASFGLSGGRCGNFTMGNCSSVNSMDVVKKNCLGQNNCSLAISNTLFGGDPCLGFLKHLSVQATCSVSVNKTFWNFTLMDPIVEDFMAAQNNHSVIVDFCVAPEWLWNTPQPIPVPTNPNEPDWSYTQGNEFRDFSFQDLVNYYKRLMQWYTQGGFNDEYGVYHQSNHHYNFPYFEVFNEMDLGGGIDLCMQYTKWYDAITMGVKEILPNTEFVGMALGSPTVNENNTMVWAQYFLNPANHAPNAPLNWISYHFYALPSSRSNSTDFEAIFTSSDFFLTEVTQIQQYRQKYAPWVKTTIDELGVILPNDNDPNPGNISDIYWNAAGAQYAYIFGNIIHQGIEVLGMSQMIGYPGQYPSVSMMDWVTGKPNSRYWVLYLLHNTFQVGDRLVETMSSDSATLYAQGFLTQKGQVILIVNKSNQAITVTIGGLTKNAKLTYVDLTTYESPPATLSLSSASFTFNAFAVGVVAL